MLLEFVEFTQNDKILAIFSGSFAATFEIFVLSSKISSFEVFEETFETGLEEERLGAVRVLRVTNRFECDILRPRHSGLFEPI